jgi:uncharacterized protein (TIRG00374 family)
MREKRFLRVIGIGILLWVVSRVDLARCWDLIKNLNLLYFSAALLLSLPLLLMKAYRWKFLLRMQGIEYPFKEAFLVYVGSIYIGLITPARLGEYAKVFYIKYDRDISLGKAFSSVLADRFLDFVFLIIVAVMGSVTYYDRQWLYPALLLLLVVILAGGFFFKNMVQMFSSFLFKMIGRTWEGVHLQMNDFLKGISDMVRWECSYALFLTVVSYGLFFVRLYLIACSLDITIGFMNFIYFMSIMSLAVLLPITIAGLGTREGTLIFLFSTISIPQEVSLSFSLLILLAVNLWTGLLGFIAWSVKPLPVGMVKKDILKNREVST